MTPHRSTRPRGRPAGTGIVDDDELLDRALKALARGGYRALSMRGLARDFGVSLASIQHRYATKDELWRATIDRLVDRNAVESPPEDFPKMLQRRLQEAAAYPGLMASLLADDAPGHEERLRYLAARLEPSFAAARQTLAAGSEVGLTRPVDPEVLIATLLVGISAVGALPDQLSAVLGLGRDPQTRLAEGIADLILHGVVARESTDAATFGG